MNTKTYKLRVRAIFKGWHGRLMEYKRVTMEGEHIDTVRLRPDGTLAYWVVCSLPDKICKHGALTDYVTNMHQVESEREGLVRKRYYSTIRWLESTFNHPFRLRDDHHDWKPISEKLCGLSDWLTRGRCHD